MNDIAIIGECMIELNGEAFGNMRQTFGGDTLNTAVYLARLAPELTVSYVTAVGTDSLSQQIVQRWTDEKVDTSHVLYDEDHNIGLYMIQLDGKGERSFLYWRNDSAARYLLRHPDYFRVFEQLKHYRAVYISGISLAILPEADREQFLSQLEMLAQSGVQIVFDSNYRPRLWKDEATTRASYLRVLECCGFALMTHDDECALWGQEDPQQTLARLHQAGCQHIVLKLGEKGCIYSDGISQIIIPTRTVAHPVDTTAAGDSFNAGFLAAWLQGKSIEDACRQGNVLAGTVIQYKGAIIPMDAMPKA